LAIGFSGKPYQMLASWEDASYRDVYLLDFKAGLRKQMLLKKAFTVDLSPEGKYLYWYEGGDKAWYLLDLAKSLIRCLTCLSWWLSIMKNMTLLHPGPIWNCRLDQG